MTAPGNSSSGGPAAALPPALASQCLRALLSSLPTSIYFKDKDSRYLAVSRAKAERHNTTPEAMIGKTDLDYFSPAHAQWARVEEEDIQATGQSLVRSLQRVTWRDGREGWADTTKCPLRNAAGEIIGTFGISYHVTEAQETLQKLERTRRELIEASRHAGMAEVATGVLHNVGNVLTSLNVSANVLMTGLRYSKAESLNKLSALLNEHRDDLGTFVSEDPKGRLVPEFIATLASHLRDERERLLNELGAMQQNIDHIKEIITMQQSYATLAGVVESLAPADLVEDALRMNSGAFLRHSVAVVRDFQPVPRIRAEKAKVLQILINLIRNAKYAVDDAGTVEKIVTLRIAPGAPGRVLISVLDNGIGIPAENLARIFQHGFTTRSKGHGFGLHSARRAASSMDATITATSEGLGKGAVFTLDLPVGD